MKFSKGGIKTALLVRMVGMTAAVGILIGVATDIILYYNSVNNMQERIKENTTAYQTSVQNALQIYESKAETIAQNSQISDSTLSVNERQTISTSLAQKYGFYDIVVTNDSGMSINGSGNYASMDCFKQASAGVPNISSTTKWPNSDSPVLIVATNISNGSGTVLCALQSETLCKMIDSVNIGKSGYGFLVDKEGKIIAHKNRGIVNKSENYIKEAEKNPAYHDAAGLVRKMTAGKSGMQALTIGGTRQYVAFAPLSGTDGWSLGVSANENEMMSSFYISLFFTIGLLIILIMLAFLLSSRMASRIAKPIVSLVSRVEMLTKGDLHSEVPAVGGRDEIGTFSHSFITTVETLRNYVSDISDVLNALANGNCTVEIQQRYSGDFSPIKESLTTIIMNLNRMFAEIEKSASQVSASAADMADASQSLAQGSTEQAEAVEKLTSSIGKISQKVSKTAADATTAKEYSRQASVEVENGNQKMQQLQSAMREIMEFSTQIGKVNGIISNIAFQTNILALNASVEAARAGQAGKGFAVVAEEVRNLACKSAEAAKNTSSLIENSIHSVDRGSKLAEETAQSLRNIVDSTQKTDNLIGEISSASEEQADFLSQINKGMEQISAVVQTNSATSEEATATSQELSRQAQLLKNTLSFFKLKSSEQK